MKNNSTLAAVLLLAMGLTLFSCGSSHKSSGGSGACSASSNFCLLPTSCKKPVTFTDPFLKAAVISSFVDSGDTAFLSGDTIYNQAFCDVYTLTLDSDSITSLGGLENAIYAVSIDLSNNSISDLTPLSNLVYLQSLLLNDNNISSIDKLSNLKALEVLGLDDNNVTDISPLAGMKYLAILSLDGNSGLSNIATLSGLHQLNQIYLDDDNISSLLPLYDNAYLGNGDDLYIENNPLSQISCCTYITALVNNNVTVDDSGSCAYSCP